MECVYVPGTDLSSCHILMFNSHNHASRWYYESHFKNQETEAKRGDISPSSWQNSMVELECDHMRSDPRVGGHSQPPHVTYVSSRKWSVTHWGWQGHRMQRMSDGRWCWQGCKEPWMRHESRFYPESNGSHWRILNREATHSDLHIRKTLRFVSQLFSKDLLKTYPVPSLFQQRWGEQETGQRWEKWLLRRL